MRKSICFVTYELAPVNRGGAGVVIAALAEALAVAGNDVHVLADMPKTELAQYAALLKERGITGVTVHCLSELVPRAPEGLTIFAAKSAQFRKGLYALAAKIDFDQIEFFEYAGVGFETLVHRKPNDDLKNTEIAVRIHGSLSMIDQAEGANHVSTERHVMYRMEDWAMRLADVVIAPLKAVGDQYQQIYGFDPARIRVCPPPMETLLAPVGRAEPRDSTPEDVLFYGKLQSVKGCETFVDAALLIAEVRPHLRFVLVGPDTTSAEGHSMRAHLDGVIPPALHSRFRFVPFIQRTQLAGLAARALCAVVPSKAESFCLAAHELHRVGAPLIVSDVPAFRDAFHAGDTCLMFDGTATDLAVQIEHLLLHPKLTLQLSKAGERMKYADVALIYAGKKATRNVMPHAVEFARREVESLGSWAAEHNRRHEQLNHLEREQARSPIAKTIRLGDRVQRPVKQLVKRLLSRP